MLEFKRAEVKENGKFGVQVDARKFCLQLNFTGTGCLGMLLLLNCALQPSLAAITHWATTRHLVPGGHQPYYHLQCREGYIQAGQRQVAASSIVVLLIINLSVRKEWLVPAWCNFAVQLSYKGKYVPLSKVVVDELFLVLGGARRAT